MFFSGYPLVRLFDCMYARETHQLDFCIFPSILCYRNSLAGLLFFHSILCYRNSLAGLLYFSLYPMLQKLISWTSLFFTQSYVTETHQLDFRIFHSILCYRNSLAGHVHFFRFKKKCIFFFIFLLFQHFCYRISIAGPVHFFIFFYIFNNHIASVCRRKPISWTCGFFRYTYVTETHS